LLPRSKQAFDKTARNERATVMQKAVGQAHIKFQREDQRESANRHMSMGHSPLLVQVSEAASRPMFIRSDGLDRTSD
jgi:hypothetical protein